MSRIRSIKPEFWTDRRLSRLSIPARLFYIGLWTVADERGRLNGDIRYLKGQVFPYDDLDVEPLLGELIKAGRVIAYEVSDDPYLYLPTLAAHQRLEPNRVRSRLPEPPDDVLGMLCLSEHYADTSAQNADLSALARARSRDMLHGIRDGGTSAQSADKSARIPDDFAPSPPLLSWAAAKTPDVNVDRETEKFTNYWRAKAGAGARKTNWDATWRNWMLRAQDDAEQRGGSPPRRREDEEGPPPWQS